MKLLELFQIIEGVLLLEARIDHLKSTLGPKLVTKFYADRNPNSTTDLSDLDDYDQAHEIDIVFDQFASADPTPQKKFTQWLIQLYLKGNLNIEDLYKAREYIQLFLANAKQLQPEQRDINRYKSLQELSAVVLPFKGQSAPESQRQKNKEIGIKMHSPEHSETVYNSPTMKVVIPKTEAASCYFGKNTEWCTAATSSDNMFDYYNDRGKLYIILIKKENKRFQYHKETQSFMDENDHTVDGGEVIESYPELEKALGKDLSGQIILGSLHRGEYSDIDWGYFSDTAIYDHFLSNPRDIEYFPVSGIPETAWVGAISGASDMSLGGRIVKEYQATQEVTDEFVMAAIDNIPALAIEFKTLSPAMAEYGSKNVPQLAGHFGDRETNHNVRNASAHPEDIGETLLPLPQLYKEKGISVELMGRLYNALDSIDNDNIEGFSDELNQFKLQTFEELIYFYTTWADRNNTSDFRKAALSVRGSAKAAISSHKHWLVGIDKLEIAVLNTLDSEQRSIVHDVMVDVEHVEPFDYDDVGELHRQIYKADPRDYEIPDAGFIQRMLRHSIYEDIGYVDDQIIAALKEYEADMDSNIIPSAMNDYDNWGINIVMKNPESPRSEIMVYANIEPILEMAAKFEVMDEPPSMTWTDMFDLKKFEPKIEIESINEDEVATEFMGYVYNSYDQISE